MATYSQAEWTRVFENIGAALSGLNRYEDAANLIGSAAYFGFVKRDEYSFFPDAVTQLQQMTRLIRGVGYSADDGLLRIEITDGGTTYTAEIVDELGSAVATISGTYGVAADVVPEQGVENAPGGKIIIQAPTGSPGAAHPVEIRIVPSAARLLLDVTGETEEEKLLQATSMEAHQLTASNFRNALLNAVMNSVVVGRLFQDFIGPWLGALAPGEKIQKADLYKETQQQDSEGNVQSVVSGVLSDLDTIMEINTPAQSVEPIVQTRTVDQFQTGAGTSEGVLTVTEKQNTAGTLILTCTKGFTGSVEDPEEFEVRFLATELDRELKSSYKLRPFRTFDWNKAGFYMSLTRKTTNDDPLNRMSNVVLKNATPSRLPFMKLKIETYVDEAAPISSQSYFRIYQPDQTYYLYNVASAAGQPPLADGSYDLSLSGGLNLSFDWLNGPTTGQATTFYVYIFPYAIGDRFVISYTTAGGRLNELMRKYFDFAFQTTDPSPTIPESIVSPDVPFIKPLLGS